MYDHELKIHGDYLAEAQDLPQNDSADGNGGEFFYKGTLGGVEVVAKVRTEVTLADTKTMSLKLQEAEAEGGSYSDLATVYTATASGETTLAAGLELGRFVLPSDFKGRIKAVLVSDDAAVTGKVDLYPVLLPK